MGTVGYSELFVGEVTDGRPGSQPGTGTGVTEPVCRSGRSGRNGQLVGNGPTQRKVENPYWAHKLADSTCWRYVPLIISFIKYYSQGELIYSRALC